MTIKRVLICLRCFKTPSSFPWTWLDKTNFPRTITVQKRNSLSSALSKSYLLSRTNQPRKILSTSSKQTKETCRNWIRLLTRMRKATFSKSESRVSISFRRKRQRSTFMIWHRRSKLYNCRPPYLIKKSKTSPSIWARWHYRMNSEHLSLHLWCCLRVFCRMFLRSRPVK